MNPVLIGNYISEKRKSMGWTQRQLARQLSVTHQAVSRWEQGLALPDIETIVAMARLFGITVDRLLNPELKASASVSAPAFEDIEDEPEEPIGSIETDEPEEAEGPEEPEAYDEPEAPAEAEATESADKGGMGDTDDTGNPYVNKHHNKHRQFKMYKRFKQPYFSSPGFKMPDIKIPDIKIPNIRIPEMEIKIPEINIPEIHMNEVFKQKTPPVIPAVSEEEDNKAGTEEGAQGRNFRSQREIDDILCKLEDLAPFVSREVFSGKFMDIISQAEYIDPETLCDLAPFLNKDAMSAALDKIDISRMDTGFIEDIAPFIRGPKLAELIMKIKDKQWLIDNFEDLIPFLPREFADKIFMELF